LKDDEDEEDIEEDEEDPLDGLELAIEGTLGYQLSPAGRRERDRRWSVLRMASAGRNLFSSHVPSQAGRGGSSVSRNTYVCSYTRSGESFVEQHWFVPLFG
jgi:hypothetical protein